MDPLKEPLKGNPSYLVADWLHFKLFGDNISTIKLKVYTLNPKHYFELMNSEIMHHTLSPGAECANLGVGLQGRCPGVGTHRPLSSSFLWFIFRIL